MASLINPGLITSALNPVCPVAHLHIVIQRFCSVKFAKPAHEHNLQILSKHLGKPSFLLHD